jgi:glutamine---fructose-6-phosphate transaminase (isomerizing)
MCGIIGYIGNRNATPILIEGLKKLEYRGYDSAGISVIANQRIQQVKKKGAIAELESSPELAEITGSIGIAHTRWATHGEPSQRNAHPHTNKAGTISIIHNGIIENYYALQEVLQNEGYQMVSETDSETLVHLIDKFYSGNFEDAVIKALNLVEGTFGIVAIHQDEKKIIAARRGSPLIIGIGHKEMFCASDVPAIMDHTKRVVYLQDNEIASITPNTFSITTLDGEQVDTVIHEIKWTVDQIEKKGYKHFMLKEIFEQPEAIENTLRGRLKDHHIKMDLGIDWKTIKRVVITACGTSWHAALIAKNFIEQMNRIPVEVDYASEFRYRNPIIGESDLVVAISQSGETADTLAGVREAKSKGAKVIGIVNVVGSTIAREVDSGIYLHAGPEIGVASTKAFTCQITALLLLTLYIRQESGMPPNQEIYNELRLIPEKIKTCLAQAEQIKEIARQFMHNHNFLYLGRGYSFPVALEGALKLKEISYIHAEGYPAAEMKHGPIALIDQEMPVFFIATKSHIYDKILSNMQEVKARKGRIVTVIDEHSRAVDELSDYTILVPKTMEALSPLVNMIPLQLFAYYITDLKGLNPDKPRNLAKSVTVE